ncbi:hypothetical protein AB1E22_20740 [Buttiauxella gaviniae]|uniref:Uncharacterized protein n=1 Tax=Buttiauxella gaviniae TaxID=82990 RepID=A0ABV3P035_9ENTR
MSFEYIVHFVEHKDEVFSIITKKIMEHVSTAQLTDDLNALWIPSEYPGWIDFSIEKSDDGFFIVSNLSGNIRDIIFSFIESALIKLNVKYLIEDV